MDYLLFLICLRTGRILKTLMKSLNDSAMAIPTLIYFLSSNWLEPNPKVEASTVYPNVTLNYFNMMALPVVIFELLILKRQE